MIINCDQKRTINVNILLFLNSIQLKFKQKSKMAIRKQTAYLLKTKITQFLLSDSSQIGKIQEIIAILPSLPLDILYQYLTQSQSVINTIKWLILIHNLILEYPNQKQQLHQLIDLVKLKQGPYAPIETILVQKMIAPYKMYLFRRNQLICNEQKSLSEVYHFINTIRKALVFTDILFTLGRYLFSKYNFLVDFNIVMAKDLTVLYKSLRLKLTEQLAVDNAQTLQKINEGLFNVFYNCYFSKYVSRFAPIWINTQNLINKLNNRELTTKKVRDQELKQNLSKDREVERTIYRGYFETSDANLSYEQCEELTSASTIGSRQDCIQKSRKQFIAMAEELLHQIQQKQFTQLSTREFIP